MSQIVDLFSYQPATYRINLRRFYRELDGTIFKSSMTISDRAEFFIRIRGRFLFISRQKKKITLQEAAKYTGIPWPFLALIEEGRAPIHDDSFLRLCRFYGTSEESLVLTRKIEKTLCSKGEESTLIPPPSGTRA